MKVGDTLYCDWCGEKTEEHEAWDIQWHKVAPLEPYMCLINIICPDCKLEMHQAVAEIETRRRALVAAKTDSSPNSG